MAVNNLPSVVVRGRARLAADRTRDLLVVSPTPYRCATRSQTGHATPSAGRRRIYAMHAMRPKSERLAVVGRSQLHVNAVVGRFVHLG